MEARLEQDDLERGRDVLQEFLNEDRLDFERRIRDRQELHLREQVLKNPEFLQALATLFEIFSRNNGEYFEVASNIVSKVQVESEVAGVLAASIIGGFLESEGIEPFYTDKKGRLRNHRNIEAWLAERVQGVVEDLSPTHARLLIGVLLKYLLSEKRNF